MNGAAQVLVVEVAAGRVLGRARQRLEGRGSLSKQLIDRGADPLRLQAQGVRELRGRLGAIRLRDRPLGGDQLQVAEGDRMQQHPYAPLLAQRLG